MTTPTAINPELTEALKAQMADIVTPAPVAAWPPAWGWWVLASLVVLMAITLTYWLVRRHRQNRYRQQALHELNRMAPENLHEQVQDLLALTKACVLSARPALRSEIAAMPATTWVQWLNTTSGKVIFDTEAAAMIAEFAYRPSERPPAPQLTQATQTWLRQHRLQEGQHA